MTKIVGESFDGAANMRSEFVGVQACLKDDAPDSIYVWCYSHVLNLCVTDCCDNLQAKNLFGTLNCLAVFFSKSYKRMGVWIEQNKSKIGEKIENLIHN
jgi:hypothetical protein